MPPKGWKRGLAGRNPGKQYQPNCAKNAKTKKIVVTSGRGSQALLKGVFDMRGLIGKQYKIRLEALRQHIGPDAITVPMEKLLDQAVRISLIEDMSWSELISANSIMTKHGLHPAFDGLLKASRDHRELLKILGITRKVKELSLTDYLQQHDAKQLTNKEPPNET